jgi:hypothetical protein
MLTAGGILWRAMSVSSALSTKKTAFGDRWLTVGGMLAGQEVTDQVLGYTVEQGQGD